MIEFKRRAPATVDNPEAGGDVLFLDSNGVFYTKASNGALTVLGRGIVSIAKVGTVGLVDTYRITFSGGDTQDYTVTNGRDGLDGQGQPAVNNPSKIDPDDAASIGTRTAFYALEDHQHQIDAAAPVALGASASEGTSSAFARADHVHVNPVIAHEAAADPHPQYTTTAEASAAAPVQSVSAGTGISVNATTGNVTVTNADRGSTAVATHEAAADPHPQYTTTAEASAAAPVQSVAGRTGAVTLTSADVGLNNVRNPVAPNVHTTTPLTLNQTLTAAATMTIPANSLQAGDAFEFDVLFGTLVNTTAASNLEVAVFINGAQNSIALAALGTTAVAAPGRGGRALFKLVFRTVGAAGTALANGTVHVNALANFASNQTAVQTVNTTAAVTIDVRVRTSAATSTGTVQFAAIDQAT